MSHFISYTALKKATLHICSFFLEASLDSRIVLKLTSLRQTKCRVMQQDTGSNTKLIGEHIARLLYYFYANLFFGLKFKQDGYLLIALVSSVPHCCCVTSHTLLI